MTARTGMSELIDVLRGMVEAGSADYTLGTATFWDGDQMQRVLDRNRLDVYREPLTMIEKHAGGGTINYYEHHSQYDNFEQTTGGPAIFIIKDAAGTDRASSGYTVDYLNGKVTFAADTAGTTLYLTGRSYDLNGAAAEIWRHKAAHFSATNFDWATDNMRVSRSQAQQHYRDMANYYAGLARPRIITLVRNDVV